ncbi:hypothetical protein V5799_032361 [Amblyomma americanum]|uniref:Uncharacterized protein n=1 Tax=Amblyomma americanum TaxID=6943 RepID=A0AAQ4DRD8_AMBAM
MWTEPSHWMTRVRFSRRMCRYAASPSLSCFGNGLFCPKSTLTTTRHVRGTRRKRRDCDAVIVKRDRSSFSAHLSSAMVVG